MSLRPLASGREADVFALDGGRVLRRNRYGRDASAEAAVMAYVHALGFPSPRVYGADGPDLVMERVAGPTLLQALSTGEVGAAGAGAMLADLHTRLHALPARVSADPAVRVLHLDLHPDNIILSGRGPVLIDWANATEGPPDLDLALTALIMAEAATGSYVPPEIAGAAEQGLREFLGRAGGSPTAGLAAAVARRSGDPGLSPAEKGNLGRAAALVRAAVAG